jgi:hypothetical protein
MLSLAVAMFTAFSAGFTGLFAILSKVPLVASSTASAVAPLATLVARLGGALGIICEVAPTLLPSDMPSPRCLLTILGEIARIARVLLSHCVPHFYRCIQPREWLRTQRAEQSVVSNAYRNACVIIPPKHGIVLQSAMSFSFSGITPSNRVVSGKDAQPAAL